MTTDNPIATAAVEAQQFINMLERFRRGAAALQQVVGIEATIAEKQALLQRLQASINAAEQRELAVQERIAVLQETHDSWLTRTKELQEQHARMQAEVQRLLAI